MKKTINITLTNKLDFTARQHSNLNWQVWIKDKETNKEQEIDRSASSKEIKFLSNYAIDWTEQQLNQKETKDKFKLLIHNLEEFQQNT
jgi:hypothetical protein